MLKQRLGRGHKLAQLQLGLPVVVPQGPHRLDYCQPAVCCHPTSSRAVSSTAASAAPTSTSLQSWHLCIDSRQAFYRRSYTGGSKLASIQLGGGSLFVRDYSNSWHWIHRLLWLRGLDL